ncbi:MtrAB system histidine kinase MtrB [Catelliglobosispora koreensis]|uniref:MtrAB system histidine kinase MtrB n=1 Tax=Catelliglobosispora koreensis TaxID=129052 RepID=UPI0009FC3986|nr:MtrAB system histidine kinase MtrB [Catelliglobosispora koreensis]
MARRLKRSQAVQTAVAYARPVLLRARRTWRRSLQLRMVTLTVLISGVLITGFGVIMAKGVNNSLLEAARKGTEARVDAGAKYLAGELQLIDNGEVAGTDNFVAKRLVSLADAPNQGSNITVAVTFSKATRSNLEPMVAWPSKDIAEGAITQDLRRRVETLGMKAHQVVSTPAGTFLVYGVPVYTEWSTYQQVELYYVVPLTREIEVSSDFRATLSLVGTLLVILLAILVVLVTRLVARPVRQAAQTAQRLSAGLLDERMEVKGEDELALLADAFNQMAANLQRQIVRLEDMSRLQRRFTSDVSHELRTPLTTVRMAADLIHSEREAFDPAVARSAELLQTELDRFEELLTDLLEISRFDAGFAMLEAEPSDVVALVSRVVDRLQTVASRAGVEVQVVAPGAPVIAEIDTRRVERILRNLLDNAIDHAERRPVAIHVAADHNAVAISVRDQGMGLKPGEEKLVFNRFWRADPSRARQTGGTGLGLSISYEDARLHNGWLEAWGAPGEGAAFRLTVPTREGGRLVSSPLPLKPARVPDQLATFEVTA